MKYLLIFFTTFVLAQQRVYVTRVIDGDTFVANGQHYRMAEIDAPELSQVYGLQSKIYLTKLIQGQRIEIIPQATDRYHRLIVKVYLNKRYIAEDLVRNGYAWWYEKYSNNLKLKQLQKNARIKKLGLWRYKHYEPYKERQRKQWNNYQKNGV